MLKDKLDFSKILDFYNRNLMSVPWFKKNYLNPKTKLRKLLVLF